MANMMSLITVYNNIKNDGMMRFLLLVTVNAITNKFKNLKNFIL